MASIYTVFVDDFACTLLDRFISANSEDHKDEVKDILARLRTIGVTTGAREQFFKLKEGSPGDLVCALYDDPEKKLRLYCIRYGLDIVVVGGGGPKDVRTWQEDAVLSEAVRWMMSVSKDILEKMKNEELDFSDDRLDFLGDLNFNEDEEE